MFQMFESLGEVFVKASKPVVLIIDEVDSATNNQVFLDFLAQLREGYLSRNTMGIPAFKSVILANARSGMMKTLNSIAHGILQLTLILI